jgi:hypothetical protein
LYESFGTSEVEMFFWLIIEGESLKAANYIKGEGNGLVETQECKD